MIRVEYGKSMYGGWYADWLDVVKNETIGIHTETKKKLIEGLNLWIGKNNWEFGRRLDN